MWVAEVQSLAFPGAVVGSSEGSGTAGAVSWCLTCYATSLAPVAALPTLVLRVHIVFLEIWYTVNVTVCIGC